MKKPRQLNPILETELQYRSRHAADQFLSDAVIAEDTRTAYSSSGSVSARAKESRMLQRRHNIITLYSRSARRQNNNSDMKNRSLITEQLEYETDILRSLGQGAGKKFLNTIAFLNKKIQPTLKEHEDEISILYTYFNAIAELELLSASTIGARLGMDPKKFTTSSETLSTAFIDLRSEINSFISKKCDEYGLSREDKAGIMLFSGLLLGTKKAGRSLIKVEKIENKLVKSCLLNSSLIELPGKSKKWIKLKGKQGWKNLEDGSIWKKTSYIKIIGMLLIQSQKK